MRGLLFSASAAWADTCVGACAGGVGAFDLIDNDTVSLSNLNRQIIATRRTVGQYKTDVMQERMLDINPEVDVRLHRCFFLPEYAEDFPFAEYDYIVDAVDTVTAKIELVMQAQTNRVPIISSMGAGINWTAAVFRLPIFIKRRSVLWQR